MATWTPEQVEIKRLMNRTADQILNYLRTIKNTCAVTEGEVISAISMNHMMDYAEFILDTLRGKGMIETRVRDGESYIRGRKEV